MSQIEQLIPSLIGSSLLLLALIGFRELIKESSLAFKKPPIRKA